MSGASAAISWKTTLAGKTCRSTPRSAGSRRICRIALPPMPARNPDDLFKLFLDGINAGDAQAVADLYEHTAVLVPDPKRVVQGRPAILDGLLNFLAMKPRMALNAARVVRN